MLDELYDNIGGKIKILAKWMFVIASVSAIITGFVMVFIDEFLILFGLLTMVCGPIVAWVGSWLLYAFGEFVEDTHTIRNKYCPTAETQVNRENNVKTVFQEQSNPIKPKVVLTNDGNCCELCGKESGNLQRCKIDDSVGWVDLCEECAKKH